MGQLQQRKQQPKQNLVPEVSNVSSAGGLDSIIKFAFIMGKYLLFNMKGNRKEKDVYDFVCLCLQTD